MFVMSEQLSIFSWNVRGLNMPAHREVVRDMILAARPIIMCLQETKLATITLQDAASILGPRLRAYEYLPAHETRGGVLQGWDSDRITTSNLSLKTHSLSMEITVRWLNIRFLLTNVYGPVDDDEKHIFLTELRSIKPPPATPWIMLGDFNLIYSARDKNNSNRSRRLMGIFMHVLDTCELFEFALQNRKYT
jgi:exonuclease III